LQVPVALLIRLCSDKLITLCSYRKGDQTYLEEDLDVGTPSLMPFFPSIKLHWTITAIKTFGVKKLWPVTLTCPSCETFLIIISSYFSYCGLPVLAARKIIF